MTIRAAADGSALDNPGPAGWAWYADDDTWAAGGWPNSTNNRGELTAVAELLEATAHKAEERLEILCDSQYVINSVTKWMAGWKKKGWKKRNGDPVLNVDLMQRIDAAMAGRDVKFQWVKGHSGNPMNEAADKRAREAAIAFKEKRSPDSGPGFPGDTRDPGSEEERNKRKPAAKESIGALFDVEPVEKGDDKKALAAVTAHRVLARAVAQLRTGDGRRARFLTRDAVVVPGVEAIPEAFVRAPADVGATSGNTAVTVARGGDTIVTCTWDISGDPKLVSLHASHT
ncbi:ribonuclease HI [Corynebacterium sp. TAE3-ERU12]|uniref:ribonuclease H family protein n=1 Tax=Corynebacterium sp. TAE3-ERU12 TaxID=2849491 RepID=UPI001C44B6BF|nr:ribonuclease H [Corynebacterium sp. TAE3-ERU12]MBV7295533.1 ribonuclease HI [Corynebacterium sp. TAE3-ERU12]